MFCQSLYFTWDVVVFYGALSMFCQSLYYTWDVVVFYGALSMFCQSLYFTWDVVVFYGALSMLVLSVTLFHLRCCCFLWSPVYVSFVSHSISPEMLLFSMEPCLCFVSHSISPEMLLFSMEPCLCLSVTLFHLRCCCFLWSPVRVPRWRCRLRCRHRWSCHRWEGCRRDGRRFLPTDCLRSRYLQPAQRSESISESIHDSTHKQSVVCRSISESIHDSTNKQTNTT